MWIDHEGAPLPRLPGRDWEDTAPNLKALVVEHEELLSESSAWAEYCGLVNDNHDLKLLLARQQIEIARLKAGSSLYKECHESVVRLLHHFDPPTDW